MVGKTLNSISRGRWKSTALIPEMISESRLLYDRWTN